MNHLNNPNYRPNPVRLKFSPFSSCGLSISNEFVEISVANASLPALKEVARNLWIERFGNLPHGAEMVDVTRGKKWNR